MIEFDPGFVNYMLIKAYLLADIEWTKWPVLYAEFQEKLSRIWSKGDDQMVFLERSGQSMLKVLSRPWHGVDK